MTEQKMERRTHVGDPPSREELLARAAAVGFEVVEVETARITLDGRTTAVSGHCDRERKRITISTRKPIYDWLLTVPRPELELRAILHHEVEHAEGHDLAVDYPQYGLYCGGDHPEAQAVPEGNLNEEEV